MKTLEKLKREMDTARDVWADNWDAYEAARDAWVAEYVYHKKLKELEDEDT